MLRDAVGVRTKDAVGPTRGAVPLTSLHCQNLELTEAQPPRRPRPVPPPWAAAAVPPRRAGTEMWTPAGLVWTRTTHRA